MHSERVSACVNAEAPKTRHRETLVDLRSGVREMVDKIQTVRAPGMEWIGIHLGGVIGCESECGNHVRQRSKQRPARDQRTWWRGAAYAQDERLRHRNEHRDYQQVTTGEHNRVAPPRVSLPCLPKALGRRNNPVEKKIQRRGCDFPRATKE